MAVTVVGRYFNPFSFLEQLGALSPHSSDPSRESVTHGLARLPRALLTHVAADTFQILDAGAVAPVALSNDGANSVPL